MHNLMKIKVQFDTVHVWYCICVYQLCCIFTLGVHAQHSCWFICLLSLLVSVYDSVVTAGAEWMELLKIFVLLLQEK